VTINSLQGVIGIFNCGRQLPVQSCRATYYSPRSIFARRNHEGQIEFVFELASYPWTEWMQYMMRAASCEWTELFIHFMVGHTLTAARIHIPDCWLEHHQPSEECSHRRSAKDQDQLSWHGCGRIMAESRRGTYPQDSKRPASRQSKIKPVPSAAAHAKLVKHAFAFGTWVSSAILSSDGNDNFKQIIP